MKCYLLSPREEFFPRRKEEGGKSRERVALRRVMTEKSGGEKKEEKTRV